jgi:hypothetical protein
MRKIHRTNCERFRMSGLFMEMGSGIGRLSRERIKKINYRK